MQKIGLQLGRGLLLIGFPLMFTISWLLGIGAMVVGAVLVALYNPLTPSGNAL
jgi:hypothetical protein